MKTIFIIVWANIKSKKLQSIALGLVFISVSILFFLSLRLFGTTGAYEELYKESKTSQSLIYVNGEDSKDIIASYLEGNPEILNVNILANFDDVIETNVKQGTDLTPIPDAFFTEYATGEYDQIFSSIRPKGDQKQITINITNNIANVLIKADENRLGQVVSNMIDNAEKHIIKEGFINIKTEIEENHVVLIIEDSGEGIESKDLPYIFEPFYQGTQNKSTKEKGAGLGLAICDYIITKHNGEIFVYSEKNKGTKFVIKLQEII